MVLWLAAKKKKSIASSQSPVPRSGLVERLKPFLKAPRDWLFIGGGRDASGKRRTLVSKVRSGTAVNRGTEAPFRPDITYVTA